MEYRTIFKCRLCGESYEGGCTGSEKVALQSVTFACLGLPAPEPQAPGMTEVHCCKNGSFGVADFRGLKKVTKPICDN